MTFDQLWKATVARNPALADDATKITITAEQYRKGLQQAYDIGRKAGEEFEKKVNAAASKKSSDPFSSIFGGGF